MLSPRTKGTLYDIAASNDVAAGGDVVSGDDILVGDDIHLVATGILDWDNGSGTPDVTLGRTSASTLGLYNTAYSQTFTQTSTTPVTSLGLSSCPWNPSGNPAVSTILYGLNITNDLGGTGGANAYLINARLASTVTSTAAIGGIRGLQIEQTHNAATTLPYACGTRHIYNMTAAGTVTLASAFCAAQTASLSGTTTEYNGLRVEKTNTAGTITHAYGIYLEEIGSRGATSGVAIAIKSDGTAKTGLGWGASFPAVPDVNLYRSAADVLKTDDQFVCNNKQIMWIPAGAFTPATTSGAAILRNEWATNKTNQDYAAFDGNFQEFVDFSIVMPERWDLGTIKVKFYWLVHDLPVSGTGVEWGIQGVAKSDDDTNDSSYGAQVVVADTYATLDDIYVSSPTPSLTIGGTPANGDIINFKVARNIGSASDDLIGDAWLLGIAIQYTENATVAAW